MDEDEAMSPDAMASEYPEPPLEPQPEPELPRATGSVVEGDAVACPRCGTPLTRKQSKHGATSLSACPSCYPSTTAGEGDLPRTHG